VAVSGDSRPASDDARPVTGGSRSVSGDRPPVTGGSSPTRSLWRESERDKAQLQWPALHFHDVFKIYRSGPVETVALRGLELRIERGELVALLGPSGCGKSTMLALAAALDQPSAGEVRAGERSLQRLGEAELARYRARDIALVFQSDNLWPSLSARENVLVALQLAGHENPGGTADEALAEFGLSPRAQHRVGALSGGEQQRVAIAAAYARRAPLVLADEPTGELDAGNEQRVLDALSQLQERGGSTVILVTHSSRVAGAADRVVEMRDGRVLA
jgi:ABC-type lipoprotein export system ATPase subunit